MWYWLQAICNTSDASDEVCQRIIQAGLHKDMLNNLRWDTLSVESLNDPKSDSKRDIVNAHISTLDNVVRRVPTSRGAFRQCQAVDIVQKFRDVNTEPVTCFHFFIARQD